MRYERKYLLKQGCRETIVFGVYAMPFSVREQFPDRNVNSIYFEDWGDTAARDQAEGVGIRGKFRLRWYGSQNIIENGVLEFKSKQGFIGKKRIFQAVPGTQHVQSFLSSWDKQLKSSEVFEFLNGSGYRPLAKVSYRRKYLIVDESLRLTVDDRLHFSPVSIGGNGVDPICPPDVVVEIKYSVEQEADAINLGQCLGLRYTKYSKYARCLQELSERSLV